ncbi:MAG: IS3 family transposase [Acidobacteria bacterium]|nr:IS3 family transposase [Acidobacteriota bacterium]
MTPLITQVSSEAGTGARAIRELSAAVSVSRSSYYRHRQRPTQPGEMPTAEQQRRDTIQQVALQMPNYGHRSMTAELQRRALPTGRDRVLRYMREADLLCRRRRAFVATTDSKHGLKVFPNLARELKVSAVDQLWVADITYIQLPRGFAYLAVLLDAFSRRVIGWSLDSHMMTELPLKALKMALATRPVKPGLIHHSDRGKQYAAATYVSLLVKHQIRSSMSRTGNPYDNPQAERFMRTVKYDEVYLSDYQTLSEARASIRHFIEEVYNRKRLHSALGYKPPVEFELALPAP